MKVRIPGWMVLAAAVLGVFAVLNTPQLAPIRLTLLEAWERHEGKTVIPQVAEKQVETSKPPLSAPQPPPTPLQLFEKHSREIVEQGDVALTTEAVDLRKEIERTAEELQRVEDSNEYRKLRERFHALECRLCELNRADLKAMIALANEKLGETSGGAQKKLWLDKLTWASLGAEAQLERHTQAHASYRWFNSTR
jgi:hypothetical protein